MTLSTARAHGAELRVHRRSLSRSGCPLNCAESAEARRISTRVEGLRVGPDQRSDTRLDGRLVVIVVVGETDQMLELLLLADSAAGGE